MNINIQKSTYTNTSQKVNKHLNNGNNNLSSPYRRRGSLNNYKNEWDYYQQMK